MLRTVLEFFIYILVPNIYASAKIHAHTHVRAHAHAHTHVYARLHVLCTLTHMYNENISLKLMKKSQKAYVGIYALVIY